MLKSTVLTVALGCAGFAAMGLVPVDVGAFDLIRRAGAQEPQADPQSELERLAADARSRRGNAAAQRAYGMALLQAQRYNEAERFLRNASRLSDESLSSLYDMARIPFARGDYRRSRGACRALERKDRRAVLTAVCRARAFLVWNRAGRAFDELESALAQDSNNYEALLALGDAHRLRAEVTEAESAYRRAIAANGSTSEPHFGLGLLYSNARRDADALEALRAARRLDRANVEIAFELGKRVRGDRARSLLQQVIAAQPDHIEALVALADVDRQAGRLDDAIRQLRQALEHNDNNAAAQTALGLTLLAKDEKDEAELTLRRSLELLPHQPDVVLALGELHESRNQHQDAFAQYRHAADLDPRNPAGMLHAAALALRLNRDVLATGFLDRLLQVHANNASALALYGDAMRARGDRAAAKQYYERALHGEGALDRPRVQRAIREVSQRQQRRQVHRAVR